jgi:hypothetical protein
VGSSAQIIARRGCWQNSAQMIRYTAAAVSAVSAMMSAISTHSSGTQEPQFDF